MKILTFTLALFLSSGLYAQNYWKGGTPGAEAEWSNPKNWSENRVPDWSSKVVIISDQSARGDFSPIISSTVPEIPHMLIESGARLTIAEKGSLMIDGSTTFNYGLLIAGKLDIKGTIKVVNTSMAPVRYLDEAIIYGDGTLAFEEGTAFNH